MSITETSSFFILSLDKIGKCDIIIKSWVKGGDTMNAYKRFKQRVYRIIGPAEKGDRASTVFDILLCSLVLLSCAAVVIEFFEIPEALRRGLEIFEHVTVVLFIIEYLLRVWVCEFQYPECKNKFAAIWEYITSFDALIDLLSIVSILFNAIPKTFAILRLIKLLKLIRLVKLAGYIKTSQETVARIEKVKKRINEIIDKGKEGDVVSKIYDVVSVILIFLSVAFILLETFAIPAWLHQTLFIFEVVIAVLFAIEYVLRVWTAPLEFPELRPDKARMHYIFSFMSLIDLLSIVPVFVANMPTASGILKIFKLCKILRLVKASRYLSGIANFGKAIQKKKKQILMSIIAITVLILICSVLLYSFESKEQPEIFTNAFSGVWFSLQTMLDADTELKLVTPIGQALSTLMLLLGGCAIGVPVAIIATGFEDMIAEQAGEEAEEKDFYELLRSYDALTEQEKKRFRKLLEEEETVVEATEEQAEVAAAETESVASEA